jgi:hypothetical protein
MEMEWKELWSYGLWVGFAGVAISSQESCKDEQLQWGLF